MSKPTIQIAVAAHKPYWMPKDSMYLPVQVGAGISGREAIAGYQPDHLDAAGHPTDNISEKNPNYCELTALYWLWKNARSDYVGLVHYRRHFEGSGENGVLSYEEAANLVRPNVALLTKRRNYYIESVRNQYLHAHHAEPLNMALDIIQRDYPEAVGACSEVLDRTWLSLFNMFIMHREVFCRYCEWLFPILKELEEHIDISEYDAYEARVWGFLAERLLNIWLTWQEIEIIELPYKGLEKTNWPKKITAFIGRKISGNKFE